MSVFPPCSNKRVFIGNTDAPEKIKARLTSITSLHFGTKALDIHGKPLANIFKPVFIDKEDLHAYNKIMADISAVIGRGRK